ncbi:hypothetical protein ACI65C_010625 [Semiaphis heraclei]
MFANLDHSVKVFTGSESNYDAADWIQSVESMADLNAWPVAYRMQFVRGNVTEAARDCVTSCEDDADPSPEHKNHNNEVRRSDRIRKKPSRLDDYV